MRNLRGLLAVLTLSGALAADWVNEGGDAQRCGCQRRETALNVASVKGLRLLWKRKLDGPGGAITAPVILGRLVTHRGTVELVFVANGSNVYAVDGDFGTVFWTRRLEGSSEGGHLATPVIAAAAPGSEDAEDDDAPQPLRPLYVLAGDGRLHALHPGDGRDLTPPWLFLPPNAEASSLNLANSTVYTTTREGLWSIHVSSPDSKAGFQPSKGTSAGVTIGVEGDVIPRRDTLVSAFRWKGQQLVAGVAGDGGLFVGNGQTQKSIAGRFQAGVATCETPDGSRWIYAAARGPHGRIEGFRLDEKDGTPALTRVWNSISLIAAAPPVAAGGLVFAVSSGVLFALDAATGKVAYSSGAMLPSTTRVSALAVANGHVCFSTSEGMLYCFGLPIDI